MEPKPTHLGPLYAGQFRDESVAHSYSTRPPYPDEVFKVLEALVSECPPTVLDLGCGTGDIAIRLATNSARVDAVDPSEAMLEVARSRPGAEQDTIRWICSSAEEFDFPGPYSLAVAGESFHWVDWRVVPGRIAAALRPEAFLALVVGRTVIDVPWEEDLSRIIPRYSTNQDFRPYDLVAELARRGLFREVGRHTTERIPFTQSIEDYVESFHTRNGFSRERMEPRRAAEFDETLRSIVLSQCSSGVVQGNICATVVWGLPSAV